MGAEQCSNARLGGGCTGSRWLTPRDFFILLCRDTGLTEGVLSPDVKNCSSLVLHSLVLTPEIGGRMSPNLSAHGSVASNMYLVGKEPVQCSTRRLSSSPSSYCWGCKPLTEQSTKQKLTFQSAGSYTDAQFSCLNSHLESSEISWGSPDSSFYRRVQVSYRSRFTAASSMQMFQISHTAGVFPDLEPSFRSMEDNGGRLWFVSEKN